MTEKSMDKAKKTTTIDKEAHDPIKKTDKDFKVELSEEELKRVAGGTGHSSGKRQW